MQGGEREKGQKKERREEEGSKKVLMFSGESENDLLFQMLRLFSTVSYLSVAKVNVGTQSTDVRFTGIIQLRLQTNVL